MKILVLGADGMLGHEVVLGLKERHEVVAAMRASEPPAGSSPVYSGARIETGIDVRRPGRVAELVSRFAHGAVVNAAGLVKQREEAGDPVAAIEVNALFPHRLARICRDAGSRLIHFSTDCVFSGRRGGYTEKDAPDPVDLYGRSKLLGECGEPPCLTLRTSIIGLELKGRRGLIEWSLAQRGRIAGYRRAIYSGLTTMEMARLVESLLVDRPALSGIWHVASSPIDKFSLLSLFTEALGRGDVEIAPDDRLVCDRSLDGRAFEAETGYRCPTWKEMLGELAGEARRRGRYP